MTLSVTISLAINIAITYSGSGLHDNGDQVQVPWGPDGRHREEPVPVDGTEGREWVHS